MVPFCPFYFRVPLIKPNSKKKGTLIVMGLLRNLATVHSGGWERLSVGLKRGVWMVLGLLVLRVDLMGLRL